MRKKIILAGPSTLLSILRTIDHLWRLDEQGRHGLTIAKQAGNLCDKFVGFAEAFEEIGFRLEQSNNPGRKRVNGWFTAGTTWSTELNYWNSGFNLDETYRNPSKLSNMEVSMKNFILLLVVSMFVLTSCAEMNKAQTGAVGGAAGGALIGQMIGHNTEATLIGAAVGTMLGYIVGNEMSKYDRKQLNHTYERGISNQTSSWVNPDSGNQYSVTPQPAYNTPSTNTVCRKAEIIAVIDGKREKTYSTACRDINGQWQLQN